MIFISADAGFSFIRICRRNIQAAYFVISEMERGIMHILTLTLDGNDFGIPLEDVEHIEEKAENMIAAPDAPGHIKGMASVRGAVIPVYDLALRFGCKEEMSRYLIIINASGIKLGLEAHRVNGVINVKKEDILSFPALLCGAGSYIFKNVALSYKKKLIVLIDVNKLMTQQEIAQLEVEHMEG